MKAMSVSVCTYAGQIVRLSASLFLKRNVQISSILCQLQLWPWLDPPLVALWYATRAYTLSVFMVNVMFVRNRPGKLMATVYILPAPDLSIYTTFGVC